MPPDLLIRDDPTAIAAWNWLAPRQLARGRLLPADIRSVLNLAQVCVTWSAYSRICRLVQECPGDAQVRRWRDEMWLDCRQLAEEWFLIPRAARAALALVDSDGVDIQLRSALTGARSRPLPMGSSVTSGRR